MSLEALDLAQNQIGDEGAQALSESQTLTGLKYLEIFGNALTEEGVKKLKECDTFSNLQTRVVE